ncbi:hypothetical protein D0T51_00195 [Parabacteroides sp. 52]|uniref:hypothetical protein n=1 Tax=unclassified Parabacteroides TaxID=2649774 RepID=UPI0013D2ACB4|nr:MULTISPECIES: hypothetical protein [unclassified Parabacteroides]MDH6533398.1 hypothetical protein [Parabacteroides sp. PM5-20]NDV54156.1 hypothetical protein [Parabacteroides sp. 52]
MKKFLFIWGLLLTVWLFIPQEDASSQSIRVHERETVMKEKNTLTDIQHRIEVLNKDMKSNHFLPPCRHVQSTYYLPPLRVIKNAQRMVQDIRLRGTDQLQKTIEYVSLRQTINYAALLRRAGYHVYALRKIII